MVIQRGIDLTNGEVSRILNKRIRADTNYMRNLHNPRRKKMWGKLVAKYTRKIRVLLGMNPDTILVLNESNISMDNVVKVSSLSEFMDAFGEPCGGWSMK